MSETRPLVVISAAALLLGLALACSEPEQRAGGAVASIDGREVSASELQSFIKDELYEREIANKGAAERWETESAALDRLIDKLVLETESTKRGLSTDALLEQEATALGPVTEEEVKAFYESNRERIPDDRPFDAWQGQIRAHLERERRQQAMAAVRARSEIQIALAAPRVEVAAEGPSRGHEEAAVTIVEFSDFQCPYCGSVETTLRDLQDRYPTQVRIVYRHLPLDRIHPQARGAAEAAVCAEAQGRFWELHAKLFANQRALAPADLTRYAGEVGMDADDFQECLAEPETKARVQRDVEAAGAVGITGTPAFSVNGILVTGARSLDDFARLVEQELARAKQES